MNTPIERLKAAKRKTNKMLRAFDNLAFPTDGWVYLYKDQFSCDPYNRVGRFMFPGQNGGFYSNCYWKRGAEGFGRGYAPNYKANPVRDAFSLKAHGVNDV